MTQPAPSPEPRIPAGAAGWYDAAVSANEAWLSACTGMAAAMASAVEVQARLTRDMFGLWMEQAGPPALGDSAGLAEKGLLLAEVEGERLADAARQTLSRLCGGSTSPPLPE